MAEPTRASPDLRASRSELLLIVEDQPLNMQAALICLQDLGFQAHVAENGLDAVAAVEAVSYGLVLMDIQMPEMDGLTASRKIRSLASMRAKQVPIIAWTASTEPDIREQCIAAGMNDFLDKPLKAAQLIAVLRKWLPEKAANEGSNLCVDLSELDTKYGAANGRRLLKMYLNSVPVEIAKLRSALETSDFAQVASLAHGMRGISLTVSAGGMAKLAKELEVKARAGEPESISSAFADLTSEFERLQEQLASMIE